MQTVRLLGVSLVCSFIVLASGCNGELKDLRIQNDRQQKRIAQLESELRTAELQLDQWKRQLAAAEATGGIDAQALREKIAALEADLAKKKEQIASMQDRLLGVTPLPIELSTKLEDFAKQHSDMVTYDAGRGIVKFKSDLLFDLGSDQVAASAAGAIKALCDILNSEEAKKFDVVVAGHTDDIPIEKPETRVKHPSNWHLSAHRAISVLQIMAGNNVNAERLSVRGFGEYRPVVPNTPNKKGNAQNRRVEIYIIPTAT
ncbi:MAG: OmpA family protein [Sedimentisphaerales bacterium]|nr:OmpA family protein [Sedimentisphaerales bacterium]